MTRPRDARLVGVEDAIVRLEALGCPCGIARSDAARLASVARWIVRRHDSAERRGATRTFDARRGDMLAGLMDERQPHGGFGPKADAECLAEAALAALGYEEVNPPPNPEQR